MAITGDQFLTGKIQGIVGLFLATTHEHVDEDCIECMFDEQCPHSLDAPFAPSTGLCAMDAMCSNWEGKLQCVLDLHISPLR